MIKLKELLIMSLLIAQLGCSSLVSKERTANVDRLPAKISDIVKLIGAERSAENIKTEESVSAVILTLKRNFQYCYERSLSSNLPYSVELFFYFEVTKVGLIRNVSSEIVAGFGAPVELLQCVSNAILKSRGPNSIQDLVFRAKLGFQSDL